LERLVRDAVALARQSSGASSTSAVDAKGWPMGYFERTAGSFANERFDVPEDPPPAPTPEYGNALSARNTKDCADTGLRL